MIDNGFTLKDVEFRLAQKGLTPLDLTAILVTHEHSDHIKGVGPLARKYRVPVYLSYGTAQHEGLGQIPVSKVFDSHEVFSIGDLTVTPVVVPHDAKEPTQYVVSDGEFKVGVLTDLGSLTPHILSEYNGCHGLLLETNHDVRMLQQGPYPPKLKARVASSIGHLSNDQAVQFLNSTPTEQLQYVIATHISEQNNDAGLALNMLADALGRDVSSIILADQKVGFDWCDLSVEVSVA